MNPTNEAALVRIRAHLAELPVGGHVVVVPERILGPEDVAVFVKGVVAWRRRQYPFSVSEPVEASAVELEVLLVGSALYAVPDDPADTDLTWLKVRIDKALSETRSLIARGAVQA